MSEAFRFEEPFALPTHDGKVIYGFLNRAQENPLRRVIVMSHGMMGDPFEHQFMTARRFFNAQGYDVVRFAYYAPSKDARKFVDCTLSLHAMDLKVVCDNFRNLYDKIYLIGHSFGGLVMLRANPCAVAASFWDSSFTPYRGFVKYEGVPIEGTPYYTLNWGVNILIGPAMIEEIKNLSEQDSMNLARDFAAPSQVVLAENSVDNPNRVGLFHALTGDKEMVEIKGADHRFTRGNTVDLLLEATLSWFERKQD